jgi:hypothetical protein
MEEKTEVNDVSCAKQKREKTRVNLRQHCHRRVWDRPNEVDAQPTIEPFPPALLQDPREGLYHALVARFSLPDAHATSRSD